tara:strand:- start:47 stop:955 length:909 start_codon:yes stop_codon:yes gene_type:complete
MDLTAIARAVKPDITDGSIANYVQNIKKIHHCYHNQDAKYNSKTPIDNLDFLNDYEKVFETISKSNFKQTMERNIISACCVFITGNDDLHIKYKGELTRLTDIYNKKLAEHKKTETQEVNWIDIKELQLIARTKTDAKVIDQDGLISALFALNDAPTRLDFADMKIIYSKKDILNDKQNYLLINNKTNKSFVFQNYKTANKYGSQTIAINKELNAIINKFLEPFGRDRKYLLIKKDGSPISTNMLGKDITRIFRHTGKKISINIIRHAWISQNINIKEIEKSNLLAKQMLHSTSEQLNYAKN